MSNSQAKLSLSEIIDQAEAIARDAKGTFANLDSRQINWKPNIDSWSIGQCFDHLMTTNRQYFPQFDHVITGKKRTTLWQSMPFLPGFFGNLVFGIISPTSEKKYKAPQKFQPSASEINPRIISNFVEHQSEVVGKMKATQGIDLEKMIIYSPATKVVIYSLYDAFRIIVAHERRHFIQAQRVMNAEGFPR
jgi:DinB superfamily